MMKKTTEVLVTGMVIFVIVAGAIAVLLFVSDSIGTEREHSVPSLKWPKELGKRVILILGYTIVIKSNLNDYCFN